MNWIQGQRSFGKYVHSTGTHLQAYVLAHNYERLFYVTNISANLERINAKK